jgi:hypothetical protein
MKGKKEDELRLKEIKSREMSESGSLLLNTKMILERAHL